MSRLTKIEMELLPSENTMVERADFKNKNGLYLREKTYKTIQKTVEYIEELLIRKYLNERWEEKISNNEKSLSDLNNEIRKHGQEIVFKRKIIY